MDLRVTLLAVPPLLPLIHAQFALDEKAVAALSSVPVLLLGIAAAPGAYLVARIGARRALIGGLATIALGAALRGAGPSTPFLFAMTFCMGAGVAISQPSMAVLVRLWFPRQVMRMTGVWSSGLLVGELLGASLTVPLILPLAGGSWEVALALWSTPVFATLALIVATTRHAEGEAVVTRGGGWPDWRNGRVWQLGLLQSSASLIYFGANTFLPDYLHGGGQADLLVPALTAINMAQVPASLTVGLVPWHVLSHRWTAILTGVAATACLPALVSGQPVLLVGAAAVLGFLSAAVLVVCFALPAVLAPAMDIARLSAGGFTIGYSTAFVTNLAAGALWDATHVPSFAFLPVLLGSVIILVLGPKLLAASGAGMPERARAPI